MPLTVFVYEDSQYRDITLKKSFPDDTIFMIAREWDSAMSLLDSGGVNADVFLFDHDIHYPNADMEYRGKTGHDLAKFFVKMGIGKDKKFLVHSDNYPGAQNIAHTLNCDGRKVFVCPYNRILHERINLWEILK